MIPERILSRVLLPAPLAPMMPRTSPSSTSNETSFSALMTSAASISSAPILLRFLRDRRLVRGERTKSTWRPRASRGAAL